MEKKKRVLNNFEWYVTRLREAVDELKSILNLPINKTLIFNVSITIFLRDKILVLSNDIQLQSISNNLDCVLFQYSELVKIQINFGEDHNTKVSTYTFDGDLKNKTFKRISKDLQPHHNFKGIDNAVVSIVWKTGFVLLRKVRHEIDQINSWTKIVENMEQYPH